MSDGSAHPSGGPGHKTSVGGELVIPCASIIFSLYFFSTIIDSPWTAQVSAFFIGAILLVLSSAFIIKTLLAVKDGEADLHMSSLFRRSDLRLGRPTLLALTIAYIFLVEWGGFTITTFFFLFFSTLLLNNGRRKGFITFLSAILALGGYALFILAFDTRFPRGPFENMMEVVLNYGS